MGPNQDLGGVGVPGVRAGAGHMGVVSAIT